MNSLSLVHDMCILYNHSGFVRLLASQINPHATVNIWDSDNGSIVNILVCPGKCALHFHSDILVVIFDKFPMKNNYLHPAR